uniref:Uncharacterized protein n=1 Tax=Setaria digitata TaxID=48799 RepID=A0A915PWI9_9BILA
MYFISKKDPLLDQSIDFARIVAAYYLGLPLLVPRNPGSLPSLYEWPKSTSEMNLDEALLMKRIDVAKTISNICDERTPPLLLWACEHHIEAIYYCDQFRDLKSQAMLRFLEEQLSGLKLLEMFCENRIEMAFKELDSLVEITEYGSIQNMQFLWGKLANSLLQMDAIAETRVVSLLHDRILDKMCGIHAMMPLFVDVDTTLPRPPVYMSTTFVGFGGEHCCCVRLWILIQAYAHLLSNANVLLCCIEYFCWNFLQINTECKNQMKSATAKYHDLLNVEENSSDSDLLVRWMKGADQSDFEQLSHLFDYLSTFRSQFTHMNEFCLENITRWRNHLLKEVILQKDVNISEMQQDLQINAIKTKVSNGVLVRAEYIARCWSYPTYSPDEQLLAMNLKLCPADFVSSTIPNVAAPSPKRKPVIEFAPRTCHRSSFDVRPCAQRIATFTSRSFPTVTSHLKAKNIPNAGRIDSWKKLDNAVQKVNVMIGEVEQELQSTSSYVKALLNTQKKAFAENATNCSESEKSYSDPSSLLSQKSETSFVMGQCNFVNEDRYSLDSSREPEYHLEIEKLNLDLLSPQPTVRNTAIGATSTPPLLQSPLTPDSQHSIAIPSPLPMWLKLLPVKQKDFLLSITPTISHIKDMREDISAPEIQLPKMESLVMKNKEKEMPPSDLKFELVTTINSKQPFI